MSAEKKLMEMLKSLVDNKEESTVIDTVKPTAPMLEAFEPIKKQREELEKITDEMSALLEELDKMRNVLGHLTRKFWSVVEEETGEYRQMRMVWSKDKSRLKEIEILED